MTTTLIVVEDTFELEFTNLGDAVRYVISRNSNSIGIRAKKNGLKIGIARTELDIHHGIGVDVCNRIVIDNNNPVTHIQIYQPTQALVDFGVNLGDLRNLDIRK